MPTIEEWRARYHREHPARARIMDEIRLAWDGHDPFGSAMGNFFAIADVLWHEDEPDIPQSWGFRHGACKAVDRQMYPDAMFADMLDAGEIDVDALTYAGEIMHRVVARCKMAGLDY